MVGRCAFLFYRLEELMNTIVADAGMQCVLCLSLSIGVNFVHWIGSTM